MTRARLRALLLAGAAILLGGCEPGSVRVSSGVYYDSMLWNDYYYGGPRPARPPRPDRPVNPVRPVPPIATIPGGRPPPVARPLPARPPIHRPAGGGRLR